MKQCKHPTCGAFCRRPVIKKAKIVKKIKTKSKDFTGFTLPQLLQFAQIVFNKYIRERDKGKPCISSGGFADQAGHYYPAGSYSGVRFDEVNVNLQSKEDNCFKSGNESGYRVGLLDRYGERELISLDERAKETRLKRWTRSELVEIINKYKIKKDGT